MAIPDDERQASPGDRAKPAIPPDRVELTPEQIRRRRQRNIAIGLAVGFLVLLFYLVTIVKLGPRVLDRPL